MAVIVERLDDTPPSQPVMVKGFDIHLTLIWGLGLKIKNFAGYRRVRIQSIEVYQNGYLMLRCITPLRTRFWHYISRSNQLQFTSFYGRGRYTFERLRELDGVKDIHLTLVDAARDGEYELRTFLAWVTGTFANSPVVDELFRHVEIDEREQAG